MCWKSERREKSWETKKIPETFKHKWSELNLAQQHWKDVNLWKSPTSTSSSLKYPLKFLHIKQPFRPHRTVGPIRMMAAGCFLCHNQLNHRCCCCINNTTDRHQTDAFGFLLRMQPALITIITVIFNTQHAHRRQHSGKMQCWNAVTEMKWVMIWVRHRGWKQ